MITIFEGIMWVYFLAAVLPAIILLVAVYRQDKVEQEPIGLIISLAGYGVLAAACSIIPEIAGEAVLPDFIDSSSRKYTIVLAFLVVAVVEEGFKFLFLKKKTWRNPNFNYRFDGIVYAVSVSLGFAAIENLEYVFGYGLSIAPARALLAIPGHMSFSVFMGTFYGNAKLLSDEGHKIRSKLCLIMAYVSAVFFHGFYDACAMIGSGSSTVVFLLFVAIMYIIVFYLIKHNSSNDRPV